MARVKVCACFEWKEFKCCWNPSLHSKIFVKTREDWKVEDRGKSYHNQIDVLLCLRSPVIILPADFYSRLIITFRNPSHLTDLLTCTPFSSSTAGMVITGTDCAKSHPLLLGNDMCYFSSALATFYTTAQAAYAFDTTRHDKREPRLAIYNSFFRIHGKLQTRCFFCFMRYPFSDLAWTECQIQAPDHSSLIAIDPDSCLTLLNVTKLIAILTSARSIYWNWPYWEAVTESAREWDRLGYCQWSVRCWS